MPTNLTCRELIEFLDDYVADRLDEAVRAKFDAHLGNCRHCRDYLSDYQRTIALGRGAMLADDPSNDNDVPAIAPKDVVQAVIAAMRKPE